MTIKVSQAQDQTISTSSAYYMEVLQGDGIWAKWDDCSGIAKASSISNAKALFENEVESANNSKFYAGRKFRLLMDYQSTSILELAEIPVSPNKPEQPATEWIIQRLPKGSSTWYKADPFKGIGVVAPHDDTEARLWFAEQMKFRDENPELTNAGDQYRLIRRVTEVVMETHVVARVSGKNA